ncbi:hypothetical protein D6T64_11930 [Cryobacterium melibiosiphilum]|uniref:Uncharacterized protein n=1 Tax=Cryobacterium melibiosiphilum TaxID=995039 RepID=A0A3A5MFA0_9MICO|nr:hypothetical protein [Cryobacterium melibiosiphilum]RJT88092.1 hypothetical protein D6T64_11930 [Cryobacterium melibiosiphilum]
MAEHGITTKDEMVRERPGTVATCTCGWRSAWGVQDGSAESDAHDHQMQHDPEARARHEKRMAEWRAENAARIAARATVIQPKATEHYHGCSCHLSAPCGACENCKHPAGDFADECPNDCQDCDTEHDY